MSDASPEIWFYHLERSSLDHVLPGLLEKTLEKGWRANVRVGSDQRMETLDSHLWTYRPDSFLPHATSKDNLPQDQPIYLTTEDDNPNGADVLFLVDGASAADPTPYQRCMTIFDARDEEAMQAARAYWKQAKADGFAVTYWQQSPKGKWEKKA